MSINWAAIKATIKEVITDIAVDQITSPGGVHELFETPKWEAVWENKNEGGQFIHPGQNLAVFLKITTEADIIDETVHEEYDTGLVAGLPATGVMNVYEVTRSLSRFTVNIRAEALEGDDMVGALGVLRRIRTRIGWEAPNTKLLASNLVVWEIGPAREAPVKKDQRMWSIASMDVQFDVGYETVNPTATGWIEKIIHTSHIGTAGVEAPAPPNVIDEQLPED